MDQYDGYSISKRLWWETQADSLGYAFGFSSSDRLVYDGVSLRMPENNDRSLYREIYSIPSRGTFRVEVKRRIEHAWRLYSDSVCTRTR